MHLQGIGVVERLDKKNRKVTFSAVFENGQKQSRVNLEYWKDQNGNDQFPIIEEGKRLFFICGLGNRKKQWGVKNSSGTWEKHDLKDTNGRDIWEIIFTVETASPVLEGNKPSYTHDSKQQQVPEHKQSEQDDDLPF